MDIELDKPAFKARAYEDEYIEYVIYALDDSGEEDGVISGPHTSAALVEGILPDLIEDFPGAYFHVVAILRNGKDRLMDSEVVWSNYPDNESKKEEPSKGANEKLSYEKGHKNSKGEDAPWVIRSHKDNRVLASFPTKKEAEDHMRTMKRYSKSEGRFTEIKAAIKAAWSVAEAKWFRLNFQESTERLDVYPIASDNEGVGVNWGVLPERNTIVQYATDFRTGNSEVEREMQYKDLDELKKIFVDEFKSMDETLEVGADNGADIHPLTESRPTESEVDKFLRNALDWASIDDGENRVILKFIADAGSFDLVGYDGHTQKTLKSGELFAVVDRYRELVEMDHADAIREFKKE